MTEIALTLLLAVFAGVGLRMFDRAGNPAVHWVLGWMAGGIASTLLLIAPALPRLQLAGYALGSLFPALLLTGALLWSGRRAPRAWLAAALILSAVRAALFGSGHVGVSYAMALPVEPAVVLASAWLVHRATPAGASLAQRLLPLCMVALACVGVWHLAWLASSGSPALLIEPWIAIAPIALGIQIQAAADRAGEEMRFARDDAERRFAERTAELAASEERYRAISELSTDFGFRFRIDRELALTRDWVSGAFERVTGYRPENLDGHGWIRMLDPAVQHELPVEYERAELGRGLVLERQILAKDGTPRWLQIRLATVRSDPDGSLEVLGSAHDITERKRAADESRRLERQMQQAQKLESLGMLAGGIAHDFNNLLTVVRGSAHLALSELPMDSPARPRLERIRAAAEHGSALTEQMLSYAGKSSATLVPVDLAPLLESMADLLRASVSDRCELALELPASLPEVEADPGQIGRVLMNLVTNASEALGERAGRVSVSAGSMDADSGYLAHCFGASGAAAGHYVWVEVADDGCGMDAETAARICEPFFTTKFSGRGLGMAAVLGIVQAHGGVIHIDTEIGRGTRVRVLLRPAPRTAIERGASAPEMGPAAARETILLADDDTAVLDLGREILERAGFRVVAASGGGGAVEALRTHGASFDAAVLDLTMPDLDGEETFLRLRELRADLPVLLVSGYDEAHSAERFRARGLHGFLRKPYELEQLVEAVRALVASSTPSSTGRATSPPPRG